MYTIMHVLNICYWPDYVWWGGVENIPIFVMFTFLKENNIWLYLLQEKVFFKTYYIVKESTIERYSIILIKFEYFHKQQD